MDRIGKYEISRLLGEGATSSVYLGFDPFTQREVAIKRLHPETLRGSERSMLYRHLLLNEASLAGKLQHPHIIQIHDAVIDDKDAYVVMEYVPGGTLEAFTKADNLLPFERLIEIIFKCTRALDYAYLHGVTHRDIKPANILLTTPGGQDIKISDFGAALLTASETTQVSGFGSPAYMSPEQVREMPVDHRTDIYSLGVVMYQLLTGRLPFDATTNVNMVYQIAHHVAPPPFSIRPEIPAELSAVVDRAMRREISERYGTWMEFSHDLAQAYRNRSLTADRGEPPDSEKFERLRAFRFFREFSDIEIWEIVRFAEWKLIPPGTLVMKEGEPGNYFCFVIEGELRIVKNGHLLNVLSVGDCFGEMALFAAGRGARTASVDATAETRILTIRAPALLRASALCQMHFYKGFLEVLSSRLSLANNRIASL
ncbi:protein kinase [Zoogloea sp.]|jgi:serine/threonine protein kinase|uniref:protein kinase domain-containing protein n=1 Tax=Zoogloea sp. TaxID=49181 RepID=UPI001DA3BA50|nr:protein kinase [Zoogloea sp.]MBK6656393.1 protein kinase [Zoogloea sp.]HOY02026.1 protein kinase [Zoogloea sp.]HPI60027.1 protein kinase [Zoogloea sp.]